MEKAAFKLDNYRFTKASLDFNIPNNAELNISFSPKGVFHTKEARYELDFDVMVGCTEICQWHFEKRHKRAVAG